MAAKVEIYGTSFCRHCLAARAYFDARQVDYVEYLIDLMPLERAEMLRRCGRKKVPQILINDVAIGGDEDLMALGASGELDQLLR